MENFQEQYFTRQIQQNEISPLVDNYRAATFCMMKPQDETELHRLADMLRDIDSQLPRESPLREGLTKAGLALSSAFIHNLLPEIERNYESLGTPLMEAQRTHLRSMGIDPDA